MPSWGLLDLKKRAQNAPLELARIPYLEARPLRDQLNRLEDCLSLRDPKNPQARLPVF